MSDEQYSRETPPPLPATLDEGGSTITLPPVELAAPTLSPPTVVRPVPPVAHPFTSADPFPRWLTLAIGAGALALPALAYLLEERVLHGDWSAGALAAGSAAVMLAALVALGTLSRFLRGRRARSTALLALLLLCALSALAARTLSLVGPLHLEQAAAFERAGMWAEAIHEYTLAGERGPDAPHLAQLYDTWGEQLLAQQQYAQATQAFSTVTSAYAASGAPVTRARADLFQAYGAWVKRGTPDVPYDAALADFTAYARAPGCDAACRTSARDLEALTYLDEARQLASMGQTHAALAQYTLIESQYASTPSAKPAHTAAATLAYALARQQRAISCMSAIPAYEALAQHYADTPEGKAAQAALAAPQSVRGVFRHLPGDPTPTAYLSKHVEPDIYYFSDEYSTPLSAASGAFTFAGVAPGAYNLSVTRSILGVIEYQVFGIPGSTDLYTVHVGPLCPVNLGTLDYAATNGN